MEILDAAFQGSKPTMPSSRRHFLCAIFSVDINIRRPARRPDRKKMSFRRRNTLAYFKCKAKAKSII